MMDRRNKSFTHGQMQGSYQLHLKDYLSIIRRRRHVVMISSVLLITTVALLSFLSPRTYQATAQILIEKVSYPIGDAKGALTKESRGEDIYLTQFKLLQSRGLAMEVIAQLQLWSEFNPALVKDTVQQESVPGVPQGYKTGLIVPHNQQIPDNVDKADIVDWYLGNLRIEPVQNTNLFHVSFLSRSPEMAARIANAHASAYIKENVEARLSASQHVLEWLKNQLEQQKTNLEISQRSSHEYKKAHKIVSFDDRQNIVSQQLADLNATLTKIRAERLAKQTIFDQLESFNSGSENVFSLPEVSGDPVIQNLRAQLIQQKTRRTEMSANYGPKHPKMIDIESGIKQTEEELASEVQRLSRSIQAEMDRALANERSFQRMLDSQKAAAMTFNEKAINYEVLTQEVQSNQQLYDTLLKQAKELGLASVFDNSNIRIVEEAEVPKTPVSPKTFWNILLSIMVSMIMGPCLAFIFEYMDNTVRTPEDVQRKLGIPLLGTIPHYERQRKGPDTALFWDQRQETKKGTRETSRYAVDPSNLLIQNLEIRLKNMPAPAFFFQSAAPGEGKTTILANSARRLSQAGLNVLMVDSDYLQPSLHAIFGADNSKGIADGIEKILSFDITQGSLAEFSIDDLFTLLSLKKLSGILTVVNGNHTSEVSFDRGTFYHIQSQPDLSADRMGSVLVKEGLISDTRLREAVKIHQTSGKPIEYVLVNAGYISPEELHSPYKAYVEEQLVKLFSWKSGAFRFHQGDVRSNDAERLPYADDYEPLIKDLGKMTANWIFDYSISSSIINIQESLSLLPAGTKPAKIGGMMYVTVLSKFLKILKQRFDIILVDTSPLLGMPDIPVHPSLNDEVILVIKAGNLQMKSIHQAMSALRNDNANILGAVLNHFKV
jgi:polysaccharide biosynthesis transport protein